METPLCKPAIHAVDFHQSFIHFTSFENELFVNLELSIVELSIVELSFEKIKYEYGTKSRYFDCVGSEM